MSPDPTTVTDPRPVTHESLWSIAVDPRVVIALAQPLGLPRVGYGAGGSLGRALIFKGHFRFGLGVSFAYERVQHDVTTTIGSDSIETHRQYLSQTSFSADLRFDAILANGFVRPWLTVGPGLSIGDYGAPPLGANAAIYKLGVTGAVRIAAGIAFRVWKTIEVGPRIELLATFAGPSVGVEDVSAFQPGNLSVGLDLGFRL